MEIITDSRIKWKCRRGLLELDIIFEKFCSTVLPAMDGEKKRLFFVFLDTPDQVLMDWVFTQALPEDKQDAEFVMMLRKITDAPSSS